MELTSKKAFDFQLIQAQSSAKNEKEVMNGDFYILESGEVIGSLSVTNITGERYVSAETPDVNFTIDQWVVFIEQIKERFQLEGSQRFMVNKYPHALEQFAM
jgi:hypothetical protein